MTDPEATPVATSTTPAATPEAIPTTPAATPEVTPAATNGTPLDLDGIERDLADVEAALARLDDGSYWIDEVTGRSLDDDLLIRNPLARRAG